MEMTETTEQGTQAAEQTEAPQQQDAPAEGGGLQQEPGFEPWQNQLPESWRGAVEGIGSADEALEALKRGMSYQPATDIEQLATVTPQGVEIDPTVNRSFRELGVKIGLTQEQAQALMDFEAQTMNAMAAQYAEASTKELKQRWGFDYDKNCSRAGEVVLMLDQRMGNRLSAELGKTGVKNMPVLIEAFAEMGKLIGEDTIAGGQNGPSGQLPPETAENMFKAMFKA